MKSPVNSDNYRNAYHFAGMLFCAIMLLASSEMAYGQEKIASHYEPYSLNSGQTDNTKGQFAVVFEEVVAAANPDAPWIRVVFSSSSLPPGSSVRIASLLDGDSQTLNAEQLENWKNRSAYFNGSSVKVELIAAANTTRNLVRIEQIEVGGLGEGASAGPRAICPGGPDLRVPAADPAVGRLLITRANGTFVCTGFIIDSPPGSDKCHLSAGHCFDGAIAAVLQFDVPASVACAIVMPPAKEQFAVNNVTFSNVNCADVPVPAAHDDWAVFTCFRNAVTGLSTFLEQGAAYTLAAAIPAAGGLVTITGFGADGGAPLAGPPPNDCSGCLGGNPDDFLNFTQQTDTAPTVVCPAAAAPLPGTLHYIVDTCGGNSGSPVINDSGLVIGIHTNAGCKAPVCCAGLNVNTGTEITRPGLLAAIAACKVKIIIVPPIPAVSDYGLIALLLLTATAGVIVIRRSRRGHAAA